jgi:hypothetical protein
MGLKLFCAASLVTLLTGSFLIVSPAAAQTQTTPAASNPAARKTPPKPPARVTVQKRSFLDAGTEVLPGQRKFTDYAFPPGYSPTAVIDYTSGNIRGPHNNIDPYAFTGRPLMFGW